MAIAATGERVRMHTADKWNRRIEQQTERNIEYYATYPELIPERLAELDREWDIERMLEAHAAALSMTGMFLGTVASRTWYLLPGVVGGFLLNHAIKGWCPPMVVLRRLGVRTQIEIDRERYALKALRGDFERLAEAEEGSKVSRITQRILQAVK